MEIKCPKCRFRFDTPVSPGISEVACVCPRCGTPFTFTVSAEMNDEKDHRRTLTDDDYRRGEQDGATQQGLPVDTGVSAVAEPTNNGKVETPAATSSRAPLPEMAGSPLSHAHKSEGARSQSHGCLRGCLLVFLALFVAAVFAVRSCYSEHSYTEEQLSSGIDNGDGYQAETVESEPTPDWLEGSWRVETEYGAVVVTIYGHHIVELDDGNESRGTFTYKDGKLKCNFFDGRPSYMRVDNRRQHLYYGDQTMEKQ